MPLNIDDIKKLPNEEKLKIIDELWESIEGNWENDDLHESPETISLLEERLEKYNNGELKSYTWEEVKQRIEANLEQQRNRKE